MPAPGADEDTLTPIPTDPPARRKIAKCRPTARTWRGGSVGKGYRALTRCNGHEIQKIYRYEWVKPAPEPRPHFANSKLSYCTAATALSRVCGHRRKFN